jgi:hypothetical protein
MGMGLGPLITGTGALKALAKDVCNCTCFIDIAPFV